MVQCGVPAVIKSIPAGIPQHCQIHLFPQHSYQHPRIPRDSRRPNPREHLYFNADKLYDHDLYACKQQQSSVNWFTRYHGNKWTDGQTDMTERFIFLPANAVG